MGGGTAPSSMGGDSRPPARRVLGYLSYVEETVCYSFLAVLVVVASLQVFTRYVLNAPLSWTEEAARMLFTWIIFIGAALIVKRGSHISIDILVKVLPPAPRRWLLIVSHVITLAVVAILAVKGFHLLVITGISESPALGIRWAYVYAAFPIGMSLIGVRYLFALIALLRGSADPAGQQASFRAPESPL
jgi:TRAP-type C4-dicarboxylate transport system permease small subunit